MPLEPPVITAIFSLSFDMAQSPDFGRARPFGEHAPQVRFDEGCWPGKSGSFALKGV
jgi:hypothetical protein